MPNVNGSDISCGVSQLYNLSTDPKVNVLEVVASDFERFVLFSDWGRKSPGETLAKYIRSNKWAGTIQAETPFRRNRNSGHMIKVWIWEPNPNMRRWSNRSLAKRLDVCLSFVDTYTGDDLSGLDEIYERERL